MKGKKVKIGGIEVDFDTIVPDTKGLDEEMLATIIEQDWAEGHYLQFGGRLNLLTDISDVKEWDKFLLTRYSPQYDKLEKECFDCSKGPCILENRDGKCGLGMNGYQARLSLRRACCGCLSQMTSSRKLLSRAKELFGRDKAINMGQNFTVSDPAPNIGILTGIYIRNLNDLEKALAYAERELNKLFADSYFGVKDPIEAETRAFHCGSILMLCMEVAEVIKICCFGFSNTGDKKLDELSNFPPANLKAGPGFLDSNKSLIAFVGEDFLPAWHCIGDIKENKLEEKIGICGIGPAGDDIVRFYEHGHIIGPVARAERFISLGLADVIVASPGCFPLDMNLSAHARQVKSLFIWTGEQQIGLMDRTGDPLEVIIESMNQKTNNVWNGIWVRDQKKAGEIAAGIVMKVNEERRKDYAPVIQGKEIAEEKWIMRAGRGPSSISEQLQSAFAILWGNSPGVVVLLGCGNAESNDLGWLAEELLARNAIVLTAGCGAGEIGRYFDKESKQYIFQKYEGATQARNLVNFGGCDASCHPLGFFIRYQRPAGGISHYGNLIEVANGIYQVLPSGLVIWGAESSERMYAIANAYARLGVPVIAGPKSGLKWNRYLLGTPDDYSKWWAFHGSDGTKRDIEPVPENLIVPVETKEEALITVARLFLRPGNFREGRRSILDLNIELNEKYYGTMPKGWHQWVRVDAELPPRYKARMLRLLREEYEWETDQRKIIKAKHRDGRLLCLKDFTHEYGMDQGTFLCNLFSLLPNIVKGKIKKTEEK